MLVLGWDGVADGGEGGCDGGVVVLFGLVCGRVSQKGGAVEPSPGGVCGFEKSVRGEWIAGLEVVVGDVLFCVGVYFLDAIFFEVPVREDVGFYGFCGLFLVLVVDQEFLEMDRG